MQVHYATVADAIRLIKRAGQGCFFAKTDIKSAFCIIPMHPNDNEGMNELLHLLDDFVFVSSTFDQCQSNLNRFI